MRWTGVAEGYSKMILYRRKITIDEYNN